MYKIIDFSMTKCYFLVNIKFSCLSSNYDKLLLILYLIEKLNYLFSIDIIMKYTF